MAWIKGKLDRTFVIDAPLEDVLAFFSDPDSFKEAFVGLEKAEEIEPGVWHWTLEEQSEKGITFQPSYRVRYIRVSDTATKWEAVEGNMRSSGSASFKAVADKTEVEYHEKIETDLPIPRLAAKIFGAIVARQVSAGVGDFLDRAKGLIESRV